MGTPRETVQMARENRRLRIRKLLRLRWLLRWMPSKRSLGKMPVLKQFGAHLQRRAAPPQVHEA